ncbi:Aste57867_24234 [Aphanomyces stellatus]|uniref:Aste57867_24234 protein n=1 Tax=Aphanomyces stellatus TaxID=120398 RepID=A0A485LPW6_9STRA|nr:hypothetical protein As57867_024159 [Aphanomyces stellatus]VFU00875.1 Aste57867_24234 [Aphanomyces stellatus]
MAAALVLHSSPLVACICAFQHGVYLAIREIRTWQRIDGVHGAVMTRAACFKGPWHRSGSNVNLHVNDVPAIMATRRVTLQPLLGSNRSVAHLVDITATDTLVRDVPSVGEPKANWHDCNKLTWYDRQRGRRRDPPRALLQLAAYNGHVSVLPVLGDSKYPMHLGRGGSFAYSDVQVAAECNQVAFLNTMMDNLNLYRPRQRVDVAREVEPATESPQQGVTCARLLDAMAADGKLEMVQALGRHGLPHSAMAMDGAAGNEHLEVVKFIHAQSIWGCTTAAMNKAVANEHDDIVRFLHVNRTEGCTVEAMNAYAARGNLAMVQWLDENRSEKCSPRALSAAASNGHVAVVEYLVQHKLVTAAAPALLVAASHGQLSVVQVLRGSFPHLCVAKPLQASVKASHDEVARYLDANLCQCCRCIPLSDLVKAKKPSKKRIRR